MKTLEEKKLLVKMAKALGQPVDEELVASIEREEKFAELLFGKKTVVVEQPKPAQILVVKKEPIAAPPPEPPPAFEPPTKVDIVTQVTNVISSANANANVSIYRDKELEGMRRTIAEISQKISTMSWGGGGTGIVRIGDADDFDRATYGENRYLTFSNGWFRLVENGGAGAQGPQGPQGAAGTLSSWKLKTSNYTAANNDRILADTSNGTFTVTLPPSPNTGDYIIITDGYDWSANNLTIARNGSTIEGIADDMYIDNKGVTVEIIYNGNPTVNTWQVTATVGPQGPPGTGFVNTATVTTSTYTLTNSDYYVGVNYAGNVNITMPVSTNTGRVVIIKDESGNCANNPITVSGTIDNDANGFILQINNGSVQILYRGGWRII